jgi:methyl-accepting chemotaxis protein
MADDISRANQAITDQLALLQELRIEQQRLSQSSTEYYENLREQEQAGLSEKKARLRLLEAEKAAHDAAGTVMADYATKLASITQEIENQKDKLIEADTALKGFNESMNAGAGFGNSLATSMGITDSALSKFADSLQDGTFNLQGFGAGLKSSFSLTKIGTSLINTFVDANMELFDAADKTRASLNKSYGPEQTQRMIKSINAMDRGVRQFNIGYEESAAAVESLNTNINDYIDMSEEQRTSLATDSAVMTRFGISNDEYSETIQNMTKAFGDSVEGAQENMREMRSFSNAIGKSTKEVMSDFAKVQGFLAQYGSNYEKVFRRMEMITRKTGVAIEDLQAIAQGFDQFEGAAESVGKLNALLGGPFLNTVDMLNTEDPAEQILKLKQAFDSAGKSVNSMSRREMQAFAQSIPGINGDIGKMKKLFGQLDSGVLDSADSINEFIEGSEDSAISMQDQAKATMTMAESMEAIQKMFATNSDAIMNFVNTGQSFMQMIINIGNNIATFSMGVTKVFSKFSFIWDLIKGISEFGEFFGSISSKIASTFGTSMLKKIPGLSLLLGAFSAIARFAEGDWAGGLMEIGSGLLSTLLPGVGTAASVAIDAALIAGDYSGTSATEFLMGSGEEGSAAPTEMAAGGIVTSEISNVTIGEAGREAVLPLETNGDYLVEPIAKAMRSAMPAMAGGVPNINLTVVLEGREMRAFVKSVVSDTLNPYK